MSCSARFRSAVVAAGFVVDGTDALGQRDMVLDEKRLEELHVVGFSP